MSETPSGSDFADTEDDDVDAAEVVPPELEAAAARNGAPRSAHTALLAALRSAHAGAAEDSTARSFWAFRLREAWARQRRAMSLHTSEWLRLCADVPGDVDLLSEAVLERPACAQLWLELARWQCEHDESDAVRTMSRGLEWAGMCVPDGERMWEAARALDVDLNSGDDQLQLWGRQFRTPLDGSERALARCKQQNENAPIDDLKRWEAASRRAVAARRPLETAVASAAVRKDPQALVQSWLDYIAYEAKHDRSRAAVVCERAVAAVEDCDASLERVFLEYVYHNMKRDPRSARSVATRAVKALPLSIPVRVELVRAVERDPEATENDLNQVVEGHDDEPVVRAWCDAYRRRFAVGDSARLGDIFRGAARRVGDSYPIDRLRLASSRNQDRCIEWRELLEKTHSGRLEAWLEATKHAVEDGQLDGARNLHRAAVRVLRDDAVKRGRNHLFEGAAWAWRHFEEDHGTLDDLAEADYRIRAFRRTLPEISVKRPRAAPGAKDRVSEVPILNESRAPTPGPAAVEERREPPFKRPREAPGVEARAGEVAILKDYQAPTPAPAAVEGQREPPHEEPQLEAPKKKRKKDDDPVHVERAERIARTIYVSRLALDANDASLETVFGPCGTIAVVRVLADKKTHIPKGAAFVEFNEPDAVRAALALDDDSLRPISAPDKVAKVAKSQFLAPPKKLSPATRRTSGSFVPRVVARGAPQSRLPVQNIAPEPASAPAAAAMVRSPANEASAPQLTNDAFRKFLTTQAPRQKS